MEDDLDWIVEQQRVVLEESNRFVREQLKCEVGSLRQQLRYAEIRENFLARSVREHSQAEQELKRRLLDIDLQKFQYKYQTVALEDDWMLEEQQPCEQQQDLITHDRFLCVHETLPERRKNQEQWIEEQQQLYRQYESDNDRMLFGTGPLQDVSSQHIIHGEQPPPYEEESYVPQCRLGFSGRDNHERQVGNDDGHNNNHRGDRTRQSAQVRFTDPLEDIINPAPPSPPRKKKESKKQAIGLCRKRSNRTAVELLALTLT